VEKCSLLHKPLLRDKGEKIEKAGRISEIPNVTIDCPKKTQTGG